MRPSETASDIRSNFRAAAAIVSVPARLNESLLETSQRASKSHRWFSNLKLSSIQETLFLSTTLRVDSVTVTLPCARVPNFKVIISNMTNFD